MTPANKALFMDPSDLPGDGAFVRRITEFFQPGSGLDAPDDPCPDTQLDLVDLASWESFPASDPPGY